MRTVSFREGKTNLQIPANQKKNPYQGTTLEKSWLQRAQAEHWRPTTSHLAFQNVVGAVVCNQVSHVRHPAVIRYLSFYGLKILSISRCIYQITNNIYITTSSSLWTTFCTSYYHTHTTGPYLPCSKHLNWVNQIFSIINITFIPSFGSTRSPRNSSGKSSNDITRRLSIFTTLACGWEFGILISNYLSMGHGRSCPA